MWHLQNLTQAVHLTYRITPTYYIDSHSTVYSLGAPNLSQSGHS
jgi:hypothetical protein